MKNLVKKLSFSVFFILILSFSVLVSSAADNTEYTMTITAENLSVSVGDSMQLVAEVEELKLQPAVTWSSSDESVATVSDLGIVNGLEEGEVEIKAETTVDGETVTTTYPVRVESEGKKINTYLSQNHIMSYRFSKEYGGFYYNDDRAAWQTAFGFAWIYDFCAPAVGMEYDYARMFFTYDEQDFLMEFWKGRYGAFIGCELGIYHRDAQGLKKDLFDFYNTADEEYWATMDMAFYRQANEGDAPEDYVLEFKRPVDKYWWCTGFIPGELREVTPADELRVEATITFRDEEMATCATQAMKGRGFRQVASKEAVTLDTFYQNGAEVTFKWQNITESQAVRTPYFAELLTAIVHFFRAIVDFFGKYSLNFLLSI